MGATMARRRKLVSDDKKIKKVTAKTKPETKAVQKELEKSKVKIPKIQD